MSPIIAAEAAECGIASLAMIANHHGHRTDLIDFRRRFAVSMKGATVASLVAMGQGLGLQGRALRLDLEELPQLRLPCILHWNLDHFVVLAKVHSRGIVILDPAVGRRELSLAEASGHFTGVAVEFTPTASFTRRARPPALKLSQLTGSVTGLWGSLAQLLALSVALQVFVMLGPFFLQWVVDQALVSADRSLLTVLGLGFGLVLLLQVLIGLVRGWALVHLSSQLGLQWMGNLVSHVLRLPLDFFQKRHLGDITSRLGSLATIQRTLTTGFIEAVIDGGMALATLAMMLVYSPRLAVVSLVAVGLYLLLRSLAFRPVRSASEQQLVAGARQQTHLLESLRGMQSLKLTGQESNRQGVYQNLMVETVNQEVRLARLGLGFGSASQLVFGVERIAVIWIGATLAMKGVFSVGMLIAYLAFKDQFAGRVAGLIDKWIEFRMLRLHGERLADIALTAPEPDDVPESAAIESGDASVEVSGLGFRYAEGEAWVVRECSFRVEAGECVAVVGASGCGKTTLVKLLLGLLPATEGEVRVGGRSIRNIGLRNLRRAAGAVMQDDHLFAGSIAENIALGEAVADAGRVQAAARLAAVHEDIAAMPMGYHSLIGDMGTTLSGGQKQRVILARALYRRPKLLFLDEATSHLDVASERLVNDAVRRLRITRIVIAHRPETIAAADRVLVMEGGRVVRTYRPRAAEAAPGVAVAQSGALAE